MSRNVHRSGNLYGRFGIAADRTELLETAHGRPISHESGRSRVSLWQCSSCLRTNPREADRCVKCQRTKGSQP